MKWLGPSFAVIVVVAAVAFWGLGHWNLGPSLNPLKNPVPSAAFTKQDISRALATPIQANSFPPALDILVNGQIRHSVVQYGLNFEAQAQMEKLLKTYAPDYSAFVALDARTGRILTILSFTRNPSELGNLALKAIFPAASVFKVVTATAVMDQNKATPDTVIAFNGADHTLYRHNVTQTAINRWTRYMTVRQAFAKSVNTVFAKLGVFFLDPAKIQAYARRFKFNENIPADVPVEQGTLTMPGNDSWALAEVASGFNRVSLMSPLQGALMAASVANDGVMMEPYLVDSFFSNQGEVLYKATPKVTSITMSPTSADQIRMLMRETVRNGTTQKVFRPFLRRKSYSSVEIGGKSGSLTGLHPRGKCDWFVGYARQGDQRIAIAALTINEHSWRVKSSYLVRRFIELYFDPNTPAIRQISSALAMPPQPLASQ